MAKTQRVALTFPHDPSRPPFLNPSFAPQGPCHGFRKLVSKRLALPLPHLLLVLLICLVWGGNFLASAAALRELPPLLFTALRLLLVGLLLLPWLRPPHRGQWPRLLLIAVCSGALHFALSFWALRLSADLSSPAILMQTYVPMSTLLAVWWLGERIGWRSALAIAISFAGVLVLGFDPLVLQAPQALLLMLASALFLAVGTVLMRGLRGMHPFAFLGWSAWIGVPLLLPASLLVEGPALQLMAASGWAGWTGVLYSALAASVLGHSLFFWLVQRHPVSRITPILLLAPLFAILLGIQFWGDRPGPRLILGGTLVLGGVLGVVLRQAAKSGR